MDVPPPDRILLVRLSHLGDVVHGLPVLHALRRLHPRASLAWVVQPEFAGLLRGVRGLERVVLFERRGAWRAWRRLRAELRSFAPDWCVDAQGNLKSALATWCSGARWRFGYAARDWQEPLGARRLTHAAPPAYGVHALHKVAALRSLLGDTGAPELDLSLSSAEVAAGAEAWTERAGAPRWILHLGAAGDPRTWPADRFLELARRLAGEGDRVLLLSGPAEAREGARLAEAAGSEARIRHWVDQRDLRQLAALFAHAAREGARLVVGDSGPSHLAAAVGLGVDLLSGPQDPARTGPWPLAGSDRSPHRVVRAAEGRCAPIDQLDLERVLARLREPAPGA